MDLEELHGYCVQNLVAIYTQLPGCGDFTENSFGVILMCEPDFAYVIAHKEYIEGSTSNYEVGVRFLDGGMVFVTNDKIRCFGNFVGITCFLNESIDRTKIKAVRFNEEKLSPGESVSLYCFSTSYTPGDIVEGRVSRTEDMFFYHTCGAADSGTKLGSPVFNKHGQFVGLCYDESCGILAASTVLSIAQNLSRSYGVNNTGINEILQHIYVSAMPKNDAREQQESPDGGETSNTVVDQEAEL